MRRFDHHHTDTLISTAVRSLQPLSPKALHRLRWILMLLACLMPTGIAAAGTAGIAYTVTDMGASFVPLSINSSGQVAGVEAVPGNNAAGAWLYSGGTLQTVWPAGGTGAYPEAEATAINDSGQVVGWQGSLQSGIYPLEYSNGIPSNIGPRATMALGIGNSGEVVGSANINGTNEAIFFSGGQGYPVPGQLTNYQSFAIGINNSGQILISNQYDNGNASPVASVESGGSQTIVGDFVPRDMNNLGQVVGDDNDLGGGSAYLASGGTVQTISGMSRAYGINDGGQIVGYNGGYVGQDGGFEIGGSAELDSGGTVTNLNSLIAPSSGWFLWDAIAINDGGEIVGIGTPYGAGDYSPSDEHAFLLTPVSVPEPTTIGLLSITGLAMLRRRRPSH